MASSSVDKNLYYTIRTEDKSFILPIVDYNGFNYPNSISYVFLNELFAGITDSNSRVDVNECEQKDRYSENTE